MVVHLWSLAAASEETPFCGLKNVVNGFWLVTM